MTYLLIHKPTRPYRRTIIRKRKSKKRRTLFMRWNLIKANIMNYTFTLQTTKKIPGLFEKIIRMRP
jgi:hypothetical protein